MSVLDNPETENSVCDLKYALGLFVPKWEVTGMRISTKRSKAMVFCYKM